MAPSNLNQVFFNNVTNGAIQSATGSFTSLTGTPSGVEIGVWDVDGGDWISTVFTGFKRIQIVQGMPSGNPIASPIIDVKDIKRISYKSYGQAASILPLTVDRKTIDAGGAPTSTKDVMLRIALRTYPTAYEYFANPTNPYGDLSWNGSGTSYVFPLLGNFSAGRMIFNVEVPASVHGGSETALITALYNAFAGTDSSILKVNPTLRAIFTATDNGTSGLVLTARHYGVEFDATLAYSDKSGSLGTVVSARPTTTAGSNYITAVSDEKKSRARYGNFNRMYFPFAFPEFAQPSYKYDTIEIAYQHDWPSSTGIARAGELNTIKIYHGKGSTALTSATDAANTVIDNVFNYTIGTASEQLF
jgi:hypothetical protein